MKVRFTKKVGDMAFEIEEEAKDEKTLFDVVEFWSCLPSEHPSGATDLRFAHRQAKNAEQKTINFYEIVCESKKERFCFGQRAEGGGLFPKGWQEIYHGSDDGGGEDYRRQPEPQRESRPAQPAQRPAQATTTTSNQELDKAITGHFKRLGISNPGQEKFAVMKALNAKVGLLVVELGLTEKQDLLVWLEQQEIGRAA